MLFLGRAASSANPAELSQLNLNSGGIDVGATSHFVAVPADRSEQPVQEFEAFTADLYRLADWLTECGVETVAMESTGVYWIPLFGVLEERGFQVILVDPRRIKNVPGRKSDVVDCQWLQQLHTYGLLSGAFRPDEDIRRLRSYLRQRAMLVEYASHHVQHMQKADRSRVPGSGVRGRGSGERETTASSLAGKEESSRKEDNSGQGKDGPAGAIAQGGNGR